MENIDPKESTIIYSIFLYREELRRSETRYKRLIRKKKLDNTLTFTEAVKLHKVKKVTKAKIFLTETLMWNGIPDWRNYSPEDFLAVDQLSSLQEKLENTL